jgi:hypothetical protein
VLAGLVAALDSRSSGQTLVLGAEEAKSGATDEVNMREHGEPGEQQFSQYVTAAAKYGGDEALKHKFHLTPNQTAREACFARHAKRDGGPPRQQIRETTSDGKLWGCYEAATNETACTRLYEIKQRDPSVPTDPDKTTPPIYPKHDTHSPGFDLLGEIALCHWSEVKGCLAGEFYVCPDDDIIVTEDEGTTDFIVNAAPGGAGPEPGPIREPGSSTWHYSYTGVPTNQTIPGMTFDGERYHDDRAYNDVTESGRYAGGEALVQKSMGTCQTDTADCPDGSTVYRDPKRSCRFTHCASGQSLLQMSQTPTFAWQGVYTHETNNFCQRMTSELGDVSEHHVDTCNGLDADTCNLKYVHHTDSDEAGDLTACHYDGDLTACVDGERHTCKWTYYMEDLINKHSTSYHDNCAGKVLESKRSLDGLLHSVEELYRLIQAENAIIAQQNVTIRLKVTEQKELWRGYIERQNLCQEMYETAHGRIDKIRKMMAELRSIASPDVRSAVNLDRDGGYQEHHLGTSESCHAAYPHVNATAFSGSTHPHSKCCRELTADNIATDCVNRICENEDKEPIACKAWRDQRYSVETKTKNIELRHLINNVDRGASFVDMDSAAHSAACQAFSSFIQRMHRNGRRLMAEPPNCHNNRTALQSVFNSTYEALGAEYNSRTADAELNRTKCLNDATYDYKSEVEGVDGIDDHIQHAAQLIHAAQGEIAHLEPKLHDVDRAVARMRNYISTLRENCEAGDIVDVDLKKIADLIFALDECPGRNDFVITIPHWAPVDPTDLPTPVPTPWYESDKVSDEVRSIL